MWSRLSSGEHGHRPLQRELVIYQSTKYYVEYNILPTLQVRAISSGVCSILIRVDQPDYL